jgi:hypothetical protein
MFAQRWPPRLSDTGTAAPSGQAAERRERFWPLLSNNTAHHLRAFPPETLKMHYLAQAIVEIEQEKRHERSEAAGAIAAVTLIGLLMCAVVVAVYPIWS